MKLKELLCHLAHFCVTKFPNPMAKKNHCLLSKLAHLLVDWGLPALGWSLLGFFVSLCSWCLYLAEACLRLFSCSSAPCVFHTPLEFHVFLILFFGISGLAQHAFLAAMEEVLIVQAQLGKCLCIKPLLVSYLPTYLWTKQKTWPNSESKGKKYIYLLIEGIAKSHGRGHG